MTCKHMTEVCSSNRMVDGVPDMGRSSYPCLGRICDCTFHSHPTCRALHGMLLASVVDVACPATLASSRPSSAWQVWWLWEVRSRVAKARVRGLGSSRHNLNPTTQSLLQTLLLEVGGKHTPIPLRTVCNIKLPFRVTHRVTNSRVTGSGSVYNLIQQTWQIA